jgi:hypothetical protein
LRSMQGNFNLIIIWIISNLLTLCSILKVIETNNKSFLIRNAEMEFFIHP